MRKTTENKGKLIYAMAALLMAGFSSCGDEAEGQRELDGSAPAQVSSISAVPGPGEVTLTWTIPSSPSFMYSKVVYKNAKGEEVYKLFSKDHADERGVMNETIGGFITTDPVDFSIYACSVRGNALDAVKYSATPGAPAFLAVAQSVTAEPDWGGAKIGFQNNTSATVYINIDYALKSDPSKTGNVKFTASPNTTSSKTVCLPLSGDTFVNGDYAVLSVTAQDADGNASDVRKLETRTKKIAPIDRSNWSFPGYVDAYGAQTGYDSQEAGGEGATPKGRVIAMLDGDNSTFWHTRWKGATDQYPHWFILDMGQDENVVAVGMRRRPGKDGQKTHTGQTLSTCKSGEASGTDANAWAWTNQGWTRFDIESEDNQILLLEKPGTARYIKAYFAETDKGTAANTIIAEINAYAPAE